MAELCFFTWNLHGNKTAHDLALQHLALLSSKGPTFAAFQELPSESDLASARSAVVPALAARGIHVVQCKAGPRLALAFDANAAQIGLATADADNEFVAARFRLSSTDKIIGVIAIHAQGVHGDMSPVARGGARGVLRQAINELRFQCDLLVVLGDFNSHYGDQEIWSWYCFNAVSGGVRATTKPTYGQRRGIEHRPLHVLVPKGSVLSTFARPDTEPNPAPLVMDFIVVGDEACARSAKVNIMTVVAGEDVYDLKNERPNRDISDHLPVEAIVAFGD
jgi:hypothetical protein